MIRQYGGAIRRTYAARKAGAPSERQRTPESQWFSDHHDEAPAEIVRFCQEAGLSLSGRTVADVGCGDGIMALGLCRLTRPRKLVGFDIVPTDIEKLLARIRSEGVIEALPDELEFRGSEPTAIHAPDAGFDFVYSWSAFEHIADPAAVLAEIRRILRPDGHFFLQLWPFYRSAKGSHLWDWFDQDFHHLVDNERDIAAQLQASGRHSADWTAYMVREFEGLNRITVDELQRKVLAAGFRVTRLELITDPVAPGPELSSYPWSDLAIGGVKLLALPG
ncbi:MAG: class I SAM-dependent methyltransferase [Solirubrobacteraceae bacterium]